MLDAVRRSGLPSWPKTQRHARWPARVLRPPDLVAGELEALLLARVAGARHRRDRPDDRAAGLVAEAHAQHAGLVRPRGVGEADQHPRRQVVAEAGAAVDREQRGAGDGPRRGGRRGGGDGRRRAGRRRASASRPNLGCGRLAILEDSVSDVLDLLDWKRRVFALYAEVRAAAEPERAWERWREVRGELFRTHPQSPRPGLRPARVLPLRPGAALPRRGRAGRAGAARDRLERRRAASGSRASRPPASAGTSSSCTGSTPTAAASSSRSATRPRAARPTAPAATCSTPSRAPTSARTAAGSCSTSTSPTTRRARTTRGGRARSRRRRTGWTCRSAPASGSVARASRRAGARRRRTRASCGRLR